MIRYYGLAVVFVLIMTTRVSASESKPYPRNLLRIDVLAPMANSGMYGASYERVFDAGKSFGGAKSFLVGFAMADEMDINHYSIKDLQASNIYGVGIAVRNYGSESLSGVYSQHGISYVTGKASGNKYDWRGQGRYHEYELHGGEVQTGLGLQFLVARTFLVDFGISARVSFGNLTNKGQDKDAKDEHLVGWSFVIAGGVGVAF